VAQAGDVAMPPFHPVAGADPIADLGQDFADGVRDLDVLCGWNADDVSAFTGTAAQPETSELTRQLLAQPITALKNELTQAGATATTYRLDWRPTGSPFGATHGAHV
jgi:para-nitrobenzyl esterase